MSVWGGRAPGFIYPGTPLVQRESGPSVVQREASQSYRDAPAKVIEQALNQRHGPTVSTGDCKMSRIALAAAVRVEGDRPMASRVEIIPEPGQGLDRLRDF